jgi:hypothetical protein
MPAGRKPALAYCHKAVHMPATFGGTTTRLLQPLAKALRQWRQVLCSRQGFSWWSVGELFDGSADGVDGMVKEKSSSRSHCPTGDNHFIIAEV